MSKCFRIVMGQGKNTQLGPLNSQLFGLGNINSVSKNRINKIPSYFHVFFYQGHIHISPVDKKKIPM